MREIEKLCSLSSSSALYSYHVSDAAGTELATPRPAPLRVPSQLFDDTPAAAELVMPLKGRRVGVYKQLFEDASPEVVSACRNAVDLLREHGCEARCSCHVQHHVNCHVLKPRHHNFLLFG